MRVGRIQPLGDLPADAQHLGQRRLRLALQPVFQRFAAQQRHGEEQHAAIFLDLIDRDDVVVFQPGRGPRLAQKALAEDGLLRPSPAASL